MTEEINAVELMREEKERLAAQPKRSIVPMRLGSHEGALAMAIGYIRQHQSRMKEHDEDHEMRCVLAIIKCVRGEIEKLERINPNYLDILYEAYEAYEANERQSGVQSGMEI